MRSVAIIGAGAAGCFCAAQLRSLAPELAVTVFEAGPKPLAKVAITGGGRCNLTNSFAGIRSLKEAYPRGERVMKRALKAFSQEDAVRWFEAQGVPCVLQEDHCWFPQSQNAMDIVNALQRAMKGADVRLKTPVISVAQPVVGNYFSQDFAKNQFSSDSTEPTHINVNGEPFDFVVITTGGAPKGVPFLEGLGLEMIPPVPSLFTFTVPDPSLRSLMGLVVEASIGLQGTAFKAQGALLITDWGLSGPATLKLSSYAARHLAETGYKGTLGINWLCLSENEARELLQKTAAENPQKQVSTTHLLQSRLWNHLIQKAGLREGIRWAEVGSKGLNRLSAVLTADNYPLSGKSKFREEFVTCGGVALSNVDLSTLECKTHPGLYFAGEVLDIDAITGGFNLQAAWSTGYVCAQSIVKSL
ncbi:MAG: aminoacetone oxidase family FAD-binding enzyme [Bacteroidales bacterium]|nr:aminoacetone oxidase family FAD-binding enzyme [Bacteroidales bacterium]